MRRLTNLLITAMLIPLTILLGCRKGPGVPYIPSTDENGQEQTGNSDNDSSSGGQNPPQHSQPSLIEKILFFSERDGNSEVYIMNTDGSNQINLTNNPAEDVLPTWHPDGSKILFESTRDGNYEIYIMDRDGTGVTRLTDNDGWDGFPVFSPDGSKIAFISHRDYDDERGNIYVMDPDGGNQRRLTESKSYKAFPSWCPGGTRILFWESTYNDSLFTVNVDDSSITPIAEGEEESGAGYACPVFSPDGSKIAYSFFPSWTSENADVYVMNSDGTNKTNLTNSSSENFPSSWSPDGSQLAFTSSRDGDYDVYVMNSDGTNQRRLTTNSADDQCPSWSPVGFEE